MEEYRTIKGELGDQLKIRITIESRSN